MCNSTLRVPVCVRDGEALATITVAGVEFQMGSGELSSLLACARMDVANAAEPVRRILGRFLELAIQVCDSTSCLSSDPPAADMEGNRKRWEKTGIGGAQDFGPLLAKLAELEEATKQDWDGERKKFTERNERLFASEEITATALA